jgi:hypothetical protein
MLIDLLASASFGFGTGFVMGMQLITKRLSDLFTCHHVSDVIPDVSLLLDKTSFPTTRVIVVLVSSSDGINNLGNNNGFLQFGLAFCGICLEKRFESWLEIVDCHCASWPSFLWHK